MNVYFEFYSIGGLGNRNLLMSETENGVIQPWRGKGISAKVGKFTDFRAFVTL